MGFCVPSESHLVSPSLTFQVFRRLLSGFWLCPCAFSESPLLTASEVFSNEVFSNEVFSDEVFSDSSICPPLPLMYSCFFSETHSETHLSLSLCISYFPLTRLGVGVLLCCSVTSSGFYFFLFLPLPLPLPLHFFPPLP